MILVGSAAAKFRGAELGRPMADIDVIATPVEFETFVDVNKSTIGKVDIDHGHRARIFPKPGVKRRIIEIDFEDSTSDKLLAAMDHNMTVPLLNTVVQVAGFNSLYLTKRSHANLPGNFEKNLQDLLLLKKYVGAITEQEEAYYQQRKKECKNRFEKFRTSRFTMDLPNEDFFELSNHVRVFEHDDIHKAIAFEKGQPVYQRCKRDLDRAKIDRDMFLALPPDIRIHKPQEEFMVIGIERFYMHDRSMNQKQVYSRGLVKTIRDLFTGWFQDFCLDNIDLLARIPDHDFLSRFETAEKAGELALLEKSDNDRPVSLIDQAIQMMANKRYEDAESLLQTLLQGGGKDAVAFYYMGVSSFNRGDRISAEQNFRASLAQDERNWQAWNALGVVMREQGNSDEAAQCFRDSVGHKADFLPGLLNLGQILEQKGETDEAIHVFRLAQDINPHDDLANKAIDSLLKQL